MTSTQVHPFVSTRIDISGQPAVVTRTELLALFTAYKTAAADRLDAEAVRFSTLTPSDNVREWYTVARRADTAAHKAMLDAIAGLGIPA